MQATGSISEARQAAAERSGRLAGAILRIGLAALLLFSVGCAASRDTVLGLDDVDPQLSAAENLSRLAASERTTTPATPLLVPVPPGVEPSVLALRAPEDAAALMSAPSALQDMAAADAAPTIEGVDRGDLDPQTQRDALRHYVKGRDAALRNRHLVAITELQKAHDLDPQSSSILRELARSFLAMGNTGRAVMLYERLLAIEPDSPEALYTLGLAAARRRDFSEAVRMLGRRRLAGESFSHDPAADVIADFTLTHALDQLGYDRASIETAQTVLAMSPRLTQPTMHLARYGAVYRQRGELWRSVGDAYCRLGEYQHALESYAVSAQLPSPDPAALYPRVIFANLRLGRAFSSQLELLEVLAAQSAPVTDREVLLCAYVADNGKPLDLISQAVADLYEQRGDDAGLARAASTFLPRDEALTLLRGLVDSRPDDLEVLYQLFGWLVGSDLQAAVELTVSLCGDRSAQAGDYVERLAVAMPEPGAALPLLHQMTASPAQSQVLCRLHQYLGAPGRAWSVCQSARDRWPDDPDLLLLQLRIAAMLQEPSIFARVADEARELNETAAWRAVARGQLELGESEAAVEAARVAANLDTEDPDALSDLARAVAAVAAEAVNNERSARAREAARYADDALAIEADNEMALNVLLDLYGPSGALEQPELYRQTARRVYEASPDSLYLRLSAQESLVQQRYEDALERFLSLHEADPTDVLSLTLAVTAWIGLGDLEEAQRWLERQLVERPGNPAMLEQWGRVLIRRGRMDELESRLLERRALDPDDVAARRLLESTYRAREQFDKALPLARQRLLEQPAGVRRALELARIAVDAGSTDDAVEQLQWIAQRREDASYEILVLSVLAAEQLNDATEQRDALVFELVQATVDRYHDAPLSVYGLGLRAMTRRGELGPQFDALAAQAAVRAPRGSEPTVQGMLPWRDLAQSLINAGSAEAAARVLRARFETGAALPSDARSILTTMMFVTDAASPDRTEQTIELVQNLADRGELPDLGVADETETISVMLYEVSQVYAIVGNDDGAIRLLEETLSLDAEHVMAKNNLGYMRIVSERSDPRTVELIEQAYAADPSDANIVDTIGWLRYKQGRFDGGDDVAGALQLIEAAIDAAEEPSAEVLDHLGDTLWRVGDVERAIEIWDEVLRMLDAPDFEQQWREDYRQLQTGGWLLLVSDPQEMYDRDFGLLRDRARAKVAAARGGERPEVAPTFDEMSGE